MKIQSGQPDPIITALQTAKTGSTQPQPVTEPPTQPETAATNQEVFNPTQNAQMLDIIHNQPEIRPEVLAKAQQMVADPTSPPTNVIANLAKLFLNSAN